MSAGLRSQQATFVVAAEQAGLAPHLFLWDAAGSPSVKPKAALTGCRRSHLCGSSPVQLGHRLQAHGMLPVRAPEGVPKALLPPNIAAPPPCTDTCHRL